MIMLRNYYGIQRKHLGKNRVDFCRGAFNGTAFLFNKSSLYDAINIHQGKVRCAVLCLSTLPVLFLFEQSFLINSNYSRCHVH